MVVDWEVDFGGWVAESGFYIFLGFWAKKRGSGSLGIKINVIIFF